MCAQKQSLVAAVAIALSCLFPNLANAQFGRDPEVIKAYEEGVAALQAGEWESAVQAFDQAIAKDDGTFAEARYGKAEGLRELEDYLNAIKSYQEALHINDKFAQAYNGRGVCFRELGDLNLAQNDFHSAAELDRRDPAIAANLGDILVKFQRPTQAMQYLDRAIKLNPEDAESYRNRGAAHALLSEVEEGIADLTKAIELDAEDHETYQALANVYLREEDYQLAVDVLSKAIDNYVPEESSEPNTYIFGYLQRAAARMKLAKEGELPAEQASKLYDAVVADSEEILAEYPDRFPESGLAMFRSGTALRMKGLFSEAIIAFTDAIQLIPPGADSNYVGEAYLIRGICWFYQDQNNLARGDFREAASQVQGDPLPYLWIGFTHAKEGNYRRAIESYGEAASKNPTFALAYVNRGLAYMQLKDYGKAVDNFNEAIRAEPTEPEHFFKRGRAHEQLGEPQKALDSYQLALLLDGDYADANEGASRALKALGRPGLSNQYENRVNP